MAESLETRLSKIKLIAMDVDGVLTDGTLQFGQDGAEYKQFHVMDGLGIRLAIIAGCKVVWISGRKSEVVSRRAAELGVHHLFQAIDDKSVILRKLRHDLGILANEIAYMGDDLNDLHAYGESGVKFAPANAAAYVAERADIVTTNFGGRGAVREMCDQILWAKGVWDDAVEMYLENLRGHE